MTISRSLAIVGVAVLMLAGCAVDEPAPIAAPPAASETPTPTPEPEPTKPELAALVVSADGLDDVVVGEAPPVVDPALDIIIFDEDYCQAAVDEGASVDPGKWIPNYEPALSGESREPFSVYVPKKVVDVISIDSEEIRTSDGLGLGSTVDELEAAYPNLVFEEGFATDLYLVGGAHGTLVFEVAAEDLDDPYYGPDGVDAGTVVFLRVTSTGVENYPWANTDSGFSHCVSA